MTRRILVASLLVLAGVFLSGNSVSAAPGDCKCKSTGIICNGQSFTGIPDMQTCEARCGNTSGVGTCVENYESGNSGGIDFTNLEQKCCVNGSQQGDMYPNGPQCSSQCPANGTCVVGRDTPCPTAPGPAYQCCKNGQRTGSYADSAACTASECSDVPDSGELCLPASQQCPGATTTASSSPAPTTPTPAQLSNRVTLPNPLGTTSPQELLGRAIKAVLSIVGSLTLLMFIYGGVLWLTSAGSPDKVKQGKQILISSTIGLVIIFSSYIVLRYVFGALQGTFTP